LFFLLAENKKEQENLEKQEKSMFTSKDDAKCNKMRRFNKDENLNETFSKLYNSHHTNGCDC
jgi:hypothetical protein